MQASAAASTERSAPGEIGAENRLCSLVAGERCQDASVRDVCGLNHWCNLLLTIGCHAC